MNSQNKIITIGAILLIVVFVTGFTILYEKKKSALNAPKPKITVYMKGNPSSNNTNYLKQKIASTTTSINSTLVANNIDPNDLVTFANAVCGKTISKEVLYSNIVSLITQGILTQNDLTKILAGVSSKSMTKIEIQTFVVKQLGQEKTTSVSAIFCSTGEKKPSTPPSVIKTGTTTSLVTLPSTDTGPDANQFSATVAILTPIIKNMNIGTDDITALLSKTCNVKLSTEKAYTNMVNTFVELKFTGQDMTSLFSGLGKGESLQTSFTKVRPQVSTTTTLQKLCR